MLFTRSDLPLDRDPAGGFLPWIVGLMVYLAALAMAGAVLADGLVERWRSDLADAVTVQVFPGPEGEGPERVVDPGSLVLQNIFIAAAPCVVLAGFVFGMAKSFGNRLAGMLLVAAGVIMIAGMVAGIPMVAMIPSQYIVGVVGVTPYFFIGAGAGVTAVGGYLIAATKRRPIRSDLDDLR